MTVGFNCAACGIEDNEAEVVIDSGSTRGHYGIPAYSYPGEGCEWHAEAEVPCHSCGHVHTLDWLHEKLDAEVREREAEGPDPRDDY